MKKLLYLLFAITLIGCSSNEDSVINNPDTIPPVITLLGENPQVLVKNETYEELGATANDNIDGNISGSIIISSTVNINQIGTYEVLYNVVDSSNNSAVASRKVAVIGGVDPIIGVWTLINEEWVGPGDWPDDQARGCFMSTDSGSPDTIIFTETSVTKNVWECSSNGDLVSDLEVFGPMTWTSLSAGSYRIHEEEIQVTFLEDFTEMQTPLEDGNITQTWSKNRTAIGDYRDGGIVFYVADVPTDLDGDGDLDTGLVCAIEDQSSGIEWILEGATQSTLNGGTSASIGQGQKNTTAMMNQTDYTGGAAKVCDEYTTTVNGITYNDWFLPSKDELNQMYRHRDAINSNAAAHEGSSFSTSYYWSSTEDDYDAAWRQSFYYGGDSYDSKYYKDYVRAVRAF